MWDLNSCLWRLSFAVCLLCYAVASSWLQMNTLLLVATTTGTVTGILYQLLKHPRCCIICRCPFLTYGYRPHHSNYLCHTDPPHTAQTALTCMDTEPRRIPMGAGSRSFGSYSLGVVACSVTDFWTKLYLFILNLIFYCLFCIIFY